MYEYAALITKVHDGDTFGLRIDLGFHAWLTSDARLEGINSPELTLTVGGHRTPNQPGEDATLGMLKLLGRSNFAKTRTKSTFGIPGDYLALPGKEPAVIVRTRIDDDKDTEKFGRVLAQVRMDVDSPVTLNGLMVQNGWAAPYMV